MELIYQNGLLYTSIQVKFKDKIKTIDNIIVDTGAVETILSPDAVEDIGIFAEFDDTIGAFYGIGDSIHHYFSKTIHEVSLDTISVQDVKLNFGVIDIKRQINGLLGLDLLMKMNSVIDLRSLTIQVQ